MAGHVVTAALVVASTKNGVQHLYKDDVVPAGITAESLANLVSLGFVEAGEEPEGASEPEAPADEKPATSSRRRS